MADVKRNLEEGGGLYLNRFWTGLFKNRSPLFVPISALGIQLIQRQDVLWDGLNVMLTPQYTLKRRYGFSKACSSAFGASEFPLTWTNFANLSGVITSIVDTQTNVYTFTSGAKTSLYTKAGGAGQSSFNVIGNTVYWVDGQNAKKYNGTTVTQMGINTPGVTPTLTFGAGSLSPTIGYQYVYVFRNSTSGHISSASAISANTGPQTSQNITVHGNGSADPQVSNIDIYRNQDGGAIFYFDATIANPGSGTWAYTDSTADANLNTFLVAPLGGINNPPPANASLLVWYAGRLWAVVGNTIYFSAGPDTTNGVGAESWPSGNNFTVQGGITAVAGTSQALLIWTRDSIFVITGTTSLAGNNPFTVPVLWQQNMGVASQNAVTQDGDTVSFFTTRGEVYTSTSGTVQEIGKVNSVQFSAMNPASVYISMHRSAPDEGIFISDGSANLWRFSTVSSAWDTPYQPVGGIGAIASMELADGAWHLLMGRPSGAGFTLKRDLSVFADDGATYSGFVTIGSLTVAPPRQVANIQSVLLQTMAAGTYPTLSVLLNEISDTGRFPATFVVLPNPVPDPPQLPQTQTILTKRHDFKAAQSPLSGHVSHMQIKISLIAEAAANEILGVGLS